MTSRAAQFKDMEDKMMARYRVLEAKRGVGAGGMTCSPVGGPVVGTNYPRGRFIPLACISARRSLDEP